MRWSTRVAVIRSLGMLHDLAAASIVLPAAFVLRLGFLPDYSLAEWSMQGALLVFSAVTFAMMGLNKGSWRYASIEDLAAIVKSALVVHVALVVFVFVMGWMDRMPRSVPMISAGLMVLVLGGNRLAYRIAKEWVNRTRSRSYAAAESVLLVGYGDESDGFIRNLRRQKDPLYDIVGIIDPSHRHLGRRMHDVSVIGAVEDMRDIMVKLQNGPQRVTKIIVASSKVDLETLQRIVDIASDMGLAVFRLPQTDDLMEDPTGRNPRPKALRIEDLLGRRHADIDVAPVALMIAGQTVLVTGAGGSIGSELVRQIAGFKPARLVLFDSSEYNIHVIEHDLRATFPGLAFTTVIGDVRDRAAVKDVMMREKPAFVFHAAALKHVPLVETNVLEGVRTNIEGTINVADMAIACAARAFVMISTDKAVNPTNVMGATKRFAEAYCQSLDLRASSTKFITVRFGNVLGSAGSVVPIFLRQIEDGGPVTVTHPDMERFFMTIGEAVQLVLTASAKALERSDLPGRIFVLDMGEPVKIVDLARRMVRLAGLKPDVDIPIVFTGLRPGEKLFEEKFEASEEIEPTPDRWLQVASPRVIDDGQLGEAIRRIEDAVARRSERDALIAIKQIVPELDSAHPALAGGEGVPPVGPVVPATTISLAEARARIRTT